MGIYNKQAGATIQPEKAMQSLSGEEQRTISSADDNKPFDVTTVKQQ